MVIGASFQIRCSKRFTFPEFVPGAPIYGEKVAFQRESFEVSKTVIQRVSSPSYQLYEVVSCFGMLSFEVSTPRSLYHPSVCRGANGRTREEATLRSLMICELRFSTRATSFASSVPPEVPTAV